MDVHQQNRRNCGGYNDTVYTKKKIEHLKKRRMNVHSLKDILRTAFIKTGIETGHFIITARLFKTGFLTSPKAIAVRSVKKYGQGSPL